MEQEKPKQSDPMIENGWDERKKRTLENWISGGMLFLTQHPIKELLEEANGDPLKMVFNQTMKLMKYITPEKDEERAIHFLESVKTPKTNDPQEYAQQLSSEVALYMMYYPPHELEQIHRAYGRKRGFEPLNHFVVYEIHKENGEVQKYLDIHIQLTFEDDPMKLLALFKDGLHRLAIKMEESPEEFKNIETIIGESADIPKVQLALEKLGFDVQIEKEGNNIERGRIEVSREKLIDNDKKGMYVPKTQKTT